MTKPSQVQVLFLTPPLGADKPAYVPPRITTYTSEEILEQVGPALTDSGGNGTGTL
jgi:hypothetical protein